MAGAKILSNAAKVALNAKLHEESFKAGVKEVCRIDLDILGKHRRVFAVGLVFFAFWIALPFASLYFFYLGFTLAF